MLVFRQKKRKKKNKNDGIGNGSGAVGNAIGWKILKENG